VRLDWSWQDAIAGANEHCPARIALQRLVGDLFLLACIDGMGADRRSERRPAQRRKPRQDYPPGNDSGITASAA
jgi:hypothetical protein